ncbi:hypothetical protein PPACK8108_LOCUS12746 [Phakopsora pachyrhizi]|uniref:Uncharacterized protein n=1 Tax=Phakopsora pachyrhizi TaxID=170000 RepID=A0AAV0B5J3_PHAPC|nr:hypothetical protein PPACK8108_LOCUS12746 [Phakopsora pachyrhizi]
MTGRERVLTWDGGAGLCTRISRGRKQEGWGGLTDVTGPTSQKTGFDAGDTALRTLIARRLKEEDRRELEDAEETGKAIGQKKEQPTQVTTDIGNTPKPVWDQS